jgi:hypothetical protein
MTFTERVAAVAAQKPSPGTLAQLEALLEEARDIIVTDRFRKPITLIAYSQIEIIHKHLGRHHSIIEQSKP